MEEKQIQQDLQILFDAIRNSSATIEEKLAIYNALQNYILNS